MSKSEYNELRKVLRVYSLDEILEELDISRFDTLLFLIEEGVVDYKDMEEKL